MEHRLRHKKTAWRRLAGLAAAVLVATELSATAPSTAADGTVAPVGEMPVIAPGNAPQTTPQAGLVIDSARGRAVQVVPEGGQTAISVFDLTEPTRPALRNTTTVNGALLAEGDHTLDPTTGLVYGVYGSPVGTSGLVVIDPEKVATGAADAVRMVPAPQSYTALRVNGLRVEPATRKILLLFSNGAQSLAEGISGGTVGPGRQPVYQTVLAQWDIATMTEQWQETITACSTGELLHLTKTSRAAGALFAPPFLAADGKTVNILCAIGEEAVQFAKVAYNAETGRLAQPQATTTFPGTSNVRRVIVDTAAQRTHLVVGVFGSYALTFDWTLNRVSGTTAVSQLAGAQFVAVGLDASSGRYYMWVPPREPAADSSTPADPGGLLTADGRRSPLPQALAFRDLAPAVGCCADSAPIQVYAPAGASSRYVFIRPMTTPVQAVEKFVVLEDAVPVSVDPPLGSLDRTTDVDEEDGLTESNFAAEAGAYGTRLLVSGGILPAGSALYRQLGQCNNANRDISFASMPVVSMSDIAANVRAFAADADQGTRADAGDYARCWPSGDAPAAIEGQGGEWADGKSECVGDADPGAVTDKPRAGARTKATCSHSAGKVRGESVHPAIDTGLVRVSRSVTTSEIIRLPDGGVESRATSIAEGVSIAGIAEIAVVRSEAVARSNGRTTFDKARSEWSVVMCGVKTASGDFTQPGCRKGSDMEPAIAGLNRAGGGRVVFVQQRPDGVLQKGSPGGYIAGVQRNEAEVSLARLENNDGSFAVAGLEIQRRNDNSTGINRQIVQLAGVRAVAAYGISLLPQTPTLVDDGPLTSLPEFEEVIARETAPAPTGLAQAVPITELALASRGGAVAALGQIAEDTVRVVREGLRVLLRGGGQALLAFGVWGSLALPWALARRRNLLRSIG